MNILCPECHTSLHVAEGVRMVRCASCGFETDASSLGTAPGAPLLPVVRDLSGETLGAYRLISMIGAGGMGVVYKAEDTKSDRTVAVKVLNPDYQWKQDEFVQRFKREIKALGRLDHPGIVRILDSGEESGFHFLVTEFEDGVNLAELLKRGQMSIEAAIRIMTDVCEAIDFAHAQGVVHRDIKPANILIVGNRAKLLDFGLAQVTGRESKLTTLTRTNLAMGTFNYLSPEQRLSAKNVDHRSDIFSLGVVFYEMLTGTLPLGSFAPPSKLRSEAPRHCDRVVTRSLQSSPDLRYPDASALSADIRRIAAGPKKSLFARRLLPAAAAVLGVSAILAFAYAGREPAATGEEIDAPRVIQADFETQSRGMKIQSQNKIESISTAPTQAVPLPNLSLSQAQGDLSSGVAKDNPSLTDSGGGLASSANTQGRRVEIPTNMQGELKKPKSKKSKTDDAPTKVPVEKDPPKKALPKKAPSEKAPSKKASSSKEAADSIDMDLDQPNKVAPVAPVGAETKESKKPKSDFNSKSKQENPWK